MAGILSGLSGLGLKNLENMDIYGSAEGDENAKKDEKQIPQGPAEKDLIYDKSFKCPVCDASIFAKIMKTGKAKLLGIDDDLRPRYDGIDIVKYDVLLCDKCGYAALSRYFANITPTGARLIKENISKNISLKAYNDDIYSYEQAMERYKLALVNAIVKKAKASEKAYICLKSAWLLRGYEEELASQGVFMKGKIASLKADEMEYIENAYEGFCEAVQKENFPMCGMDEVTVDLVMSELAYLLGKYDESGRIVAKVLTSNVANKRAKDKARDIKDKILAAKQ